MKRAGILWLIAACASPQHSPRPPDDGFVSLTLVRTVDEPPTGEGSASNSGATTLAVSNGAPFVPYKEFAFTDWMHGGDCVFKNMNVKYYSNGKISFSGDARSEDTNDCWNPFAVTAYNAVGANLHQTGNHPYCMQEKSKDFPVRWEDSYPGAFYNELTKVTARGHC